MRRRNRFSTHGVGPLPRRDIRTDWSCHASLNPWRHAGARGDASAGSGRTNGNAPAGANPVDGCGTGGLLAALGAGALDGGVALTP